MQTLRTYPMQNSAILRINAERDSINISPEYQRRGEIWTLEKKQLLIDSILNEYDIPKIYFHQLPRNRTPGKYTYAIIDGRQRLETIWGFIAGDFTLSDDFKYFKDPKVDAKNMTYGDLASKYPNLKMIFDSFVLPVMLVETDDIDTIEDMFSRLNEAVPLNAAEKRNAIGGLMAKEIVDVAKQEFFIEKVRFSDKRFQFREVAARLLFIESSIREEQVFSWDLDKKCTNLGITSNNFLNELIAKFSDAGIQLGENNFFWRVNDDEAALSFQYFIYSIRRSGPHVDIIKQGRIIDTKKPNLDEFVRDYKTENKKNIASSDFLGAEVKNILKEMSQIFINKDPQLKAQSIVPIYYLLFREAKNQRKLKILTRDKLEKFREEVATNREIAEKDISKANFELLEFDRMSQQGTNDATSIKERLKIICNFCSISVDDIAYLKK